MLMLRAAKIQECCLITRKLRGYQDTEIVRLLITESLSVYKMMRLQDLGCIAEK